MSSALSSSGGGRFDFDDGGTYCGGWNEGKAHGHGVCTGPKGQGAYAGTWIEGFEACGVYSWPTGSTYEGQWNEGKRHGLGIETRGRWLYRGEWTEGFKGRYGVRQSIASGARYDGTWTGGLQDGYGSETYADGGTFQGQWAKGMRHGYGVRTSAPFGLAAHRRPSMRQSNSPSPEPHGVRPEECRGGFVLKDSAGGRDTGTWGRSLPDQPQSKTSTLKNLMSRNKPVPQQSSFDEFSADEDVGSESDATESSFVVQDEAIDANVIETYMGEWKNDKRSGFGIAERSDGIKYEGEWFNNKKFGYGITTYKSGVEEYGKYKNNLLLQSGGKHRLFLLRSAKFKERVTTAVNTAHRASQIALQKADIAISRTATARGKAEQADEVAKRSRAEAEVARLVAKQFAPEFYLPGSGFLKKNFNSSQDLSDFAHQLGENSSHKSFQLTSIEEPPFEYSKDVNLRPQFEYDDSHLSPEPPASSAFLDVLRNNPDRRPSAAGFLRRPSAVNLRRSSVIVEHKLVPSTVEQFSQFIPDQRYYHYPHRQQQQQQQRQQQTQQQQRPGLTFQQVVEDHYNHYNQPSKSAQEQRPRGKLKPAIDLTELSKLYGIPLTPPNMEDEEGVPYQPQRRSTMPTVLDPNFVQTENEGLYTDGIVRSSSLYTRKAESPAKTGAVVNARKKSLPDITNISEPNILSREAIAALSSQRREAIRRQEEEEERLRANPLLYLLSPAVWDWFASQQLVILVLVINIALGLLFFKVIL